MRGVVRRTGESIRSIRSAAAQETDDGERVVVITADARRLFSTSKGLAIALMEAGRRSFGASGRQIVLCYWECEQSTVWLGDAPGSTPQIQKASPLEMFRSTQQRVISHARKPCLASFHRTLSHHNHHGRLRNACESV